MTDMQNRYDFVLFFDVVNGNPNGDPDAGNLPRMDPETSQGLVTDVALKRKVRNYVQMLNVPGKEIFIREREPLNLKIAKACEAKGQESFAKDKAGYDTQKAKNRSKDDIRLLQEWMCSQYYDIRAFGAVMSTGPNAGQIRGPVQMTFARSEEPILPLETTITRVADTDKEEGEIGRKHIVPYGLYRAHGFINAKLAERTGFSEADLDTFWIALRDMFDFDRSAARGEMAARRLIAFKHDSALGNAQAHKLFDRVSVSRVSGDDAIPVGDRRTHNLAPARAFSDYRIDLDDTDLPTGITIVNPF